MATFSLTGAALTLEDLEQILHQKQLLEIHPDVALAPPAQPVRPPAAPDVATSFLLAHQVTQGAETLEEIIRLALLLLIHQTLIQPASPVQPATRQRLLALYNREVFPIVLARGSDAARAAQLILPLVLRGQVKFQGYSLKAADVADIFSWPALALQPAEARELLQQPVFLYAQNAKALLDLKPLANWAIFSDAVYANIFPGENSALHQGLASLVKELKNTQQHLERGINQSENLPGSSNAEVLSALYVSLHAASSALAALNQELFRELAAAAEPPATISFAEATNLVGFISRPTLTPAETQEIFSKEILLELIREEVNGLEILVHYAFWGFIQTDHVTGSFPETSTLNIYKQAGLFVPTETVHEQIEKISTFIKGHIPLGSA